MAVISFAEIWNGRRAAASLDQFITREYTRVFRVITNDPKDEPWVVGSAVGLPILFDPYQGQNGVIDLNSRALRIEPRQSDDDPYIWEVVIEYGTKFNGIDASHYSANPASYENPTLRPADVEWGYVSFQKPIDTDLLNNAVVNSAQDAFDPAPLVDDHRPTLTISRNELVFDPSVAITYMDAVNTDVFFGALPGQAKVAGISANREFEHNLFFWRVTYEIHFRREGWNLVILNRGYHHLVGGVSKKILDKDAEPVGSPKLLAANGTLLPQAGTPTYKTFYPYKELPFAFLELDLV